MVGYLVKHKEFANYTKYPVIRTVLKQTSMEAINDSVIALVTWCAGNLVVIYGD